MKTRYSSLVSLKKNTMERSERVVQKANVNLNKATSALELSYTSLKDVDSPQSGTMAEFLASRTLLSSARDQIQHNHEWVNFTKKQVNEAKQQLKLDMIEHEKFKYLELDEIKKMIKSQKIKETKDLDEIAMMTFNKKGDT